uniref:RNA-directed DNA polymerase, eukaryota, reverse transcriptase zinc-binding domain protein n=1 Tax=Tanacetum cinerariifolium TaxID=118510 RepID=A0A6L2MT04_TANCI|nr:RNA-directed DNA polymerase, eukaryota, reverse transcriptase zinc-binding domain protein [Tanacetum cinerariifolium]
MSTHSSARIFFPPLDNPELTIRRRSLADPTRLNDFEMAAKGNGDPPVPDLRIMEELRQPSLNGRGGPISPIAIQATNFGLKNDMIQQVQNSCQFHGLPGDDANKHLDKFLHVAQIIKVNGVTDDALRFACLGSLSLTQFLEFNGPWGMFGDHGQPSLQGGDDVVGSVVRMVLVKIVVVWGWQPRLKGEEDGSGRSLNGSGRKLTRATPERDRREYRGGDDVVGSVVRMVVRDPRLEGEVDGSGRSLAGSGRKLAGATPEREGRESKEDDVIKISTSIYVTNLPERFGAMDLWNTCQSYGHVVDTFIPDKRSKAGKRFGFARFIKIIDVDKLVNNLCMIWIGRSKLHANVARFQRNQKYKQSSKAYEYGKYSAKSESGNNSDGTKTKINSFAQVVKEFASLPNLKMVLAKEGYTSIDLKYMGGLWVMIKFQEEETMNKFRTSLTTGLWNTFNRIASRWGSLLNEEELENGDFHSNRLCICSNMKTIVSESFKMAFRGKIYWVRTIEVPGWVPDFEDDSGEMSYDSLNDDEEPRGEARIQNEMDSEGSVKEVPDTCFDEVLNKKKKRNKDNTSEGSLKYPPGFTPNEDGDGSGAASGNQVEENSMNVEHAIDMNVEKQDNVKDGFQRDTNESNCSGHFKKSTAPPTGGSILHLIDDLVKVGQTMGFDMSGCIKNMEEIIESQGVNDGGILCIWDPTMFQKENETISDYFVIVRVMGDFNEVRDANKRFGSIFNKKGAKVFNNFIINDGLVELPLGGCSFTWCHKSAKKMSKLDRPILMRECHGDYGPTLFKFFHYWFEIDSFDKFVEESWKDNSVVDQNPFSKFMKKLKFLKMKIRTWIRIYKERSKSGKRHLNSELRTIDSNIDRGKGNDSDINRRHDIIRLIQDIEKVDTLEMTQKAKIKWAIEGDENSKFYHGMINKKRGRRTVRGVMADGTRLESPISVKKEFYDHFKNRFGNPSSSGIQLVKEFSKRLSVEQNANLKAPGPDGYTFGFYRRYWRFIENDIFKAIKWFFANGTIPKGGDLVNEVKSAFVADRQILDGPFILNELMQWSKSKKKQTMVFKVDFEKAVVDVGLFKGVKLSPTLLMTHLFYADDAIFMGQWNQANIDTLIHVLDVFHRASGLRINIYKSKLLGIFVEASKLDQAAAKIGCAVLNTPFTYLGSRVGGNMSRIQAWNDIIEGMVSRLSKWKVKTLLIGGRLTLLKLVLGALPIYHMSIFKVPMKVLKNLEAIRASFFNGTDINTKKPCWLSWKKVMASKDNGGLGVSSLYALNMALLFKWISIIKEVESLKDKGMDLLQFISQVLGNGISTSFWEVLWRGDVAFKVLVPRIYALETMKNIVVASKLSHNDLVWSLRRRPRDGIEQAQLTLIKNCMEGVILSNSNDRWVWNLVGSGEFSVASVRKYIDDHSLPYIILQMFSAAPFWTHKEAKKQCGNILIDGTCSKCNSGAGNSSVYDPNPKSFNEGIKAADCDPEEEIYLIEKLLYDNSSPRPPKEFISKNSDAAIESLSLSISYLRDMLILEELLSNDSLPLPKNESFHSDIPSTPRPPAKPPDDDEIEPNSGILTVKVVGDISEHDVPMPRLLPTQPTLASNQDKSPYLLSHRGLKAFQLSSECPMMIYGGNIPILDVPFLHLYPP